MKHEDSGMGWRTQFGKVKLDLEDVERHKAIF